MYRICTEFKLLLKYIVNANALFIKQNKSCMECVQYIPVNRLLRRGSNTIFSISCSFFMSLCEANQCIRIGSISKLFSSLLPIHIVVCKTLYKPNCESMTNCCGQICVDWIVRTLLPAVPCPSPYEPEW